MSENPCTDLPAWDIAPAAASELDFNVLKFAPMISSPAIPDLEPPRIAEIARLYCTEPGTKCFATAFWIISSAAGRDVLMVCASLMLSMPIDVISDAALFAGLESILSIMARWVPAPAPL